MATRQTMRETAALLRSLLMLVESEHLEAETPQAKRLLRRIEGAAAALDTAD
jgi:hypothetical protein